MKKVLFASALLLLASGCQSNGKAIKTIPEVMDTAPATSNKDVVAADPKGAVIYRNEALGFEFDLKGLQLRDDPSTKDMIEFYNQSAYDSGTEEPLYGSVAVNDNSQSLDQIKTDLKTKDDIDNVKDITVDGEPAVSYQVMAMGDPENVVVLHKGRRYDIGGPVLGSLDTFKFIDK